MTMDYGYVTVHVTTDAAQGEVLAELLRQEGIAARFRGPATTLVGVAEHIVEMAVEVPSESEAHAQPIHDHHRRAGEDRVQCVEGRREEHERELDRLGHAREFLRDLEDATVAADGSSEG